MRVYTLGLAIDDKETRPRTIGGTLQSTFSNVATTLK